MVCMANHASEDRGSNDPRARCGACAYVVNAPETAEGILAWEVIRRSAGQVRAVMGGVYAIDFGAVLALAQAMNASSPLLADILPEIEPIIVAAYGRDASRSNRD